MRAVRDRLAEERRRAFVARETELELFAQALESSPFSVLFVHGPGGIGKSTLLARFEDEARARGVACTKIDARSVAPVPESVLRALGVESIDALSTRLADRHVVLFDTYEELAALDEWIRDALLPALPERAVLVLASRDPPRAAWRTDPGIAALLRVRALRNLRAEESASLLGARGVSQELASAAHALTHGHPLALVLIAELVRERGVDALPSLRPDVVRELLDRILRALPEPRQREALEVAALARATTEPLLAELGVAPAGELFTWLRARSFVHETEEGLAPHDLVRDAIAADLAFRDPARERTLREKMAARNQRALLESEGAARQRAFYDMLFALRGDPALRPFYDWSGGSSGAARPLREPELGELLADIARHEGEEAAAIARRWWSRQPEAFIALFDASGAWAGTIVYLRLTSIDEHAAIDPAMAAVAAIEREGPLREGEHLRVLRFWIWRDRYQDLGSAAHGPHSMVVALDWIFSKSLAWCVVLVQRVELWRSFFASMRLAERPSLAVSLGDRRFHVFARDFRADPWTGAKSDAPPDTAPRIVLSQEDFAAAVREALRCAARPSELAASPLLASRLLLEWAEGDAPSPEMIRELLEVATSSLDDAKDDRPRRCVELTYLTPAPTHEAAAERLGLSFSTYRRQLARGVDRVIEYLWDREVRGARS